jgi:hypothetical protein
MCLQPAVYAGIIAEVLVSPQVSERGGKSFLGGTLASHSKRSVSRSVLADPGSFNVRTESGSSESFRPAPVAPSGGSEPFGRASAAR